MIHHKNKISKLLLSIAFLLLTIVASAQKHPSYSAQAAALLNAEQYDKASQMYSKAVDVSLQKDDQYSLFMLYNEWGGCKKYQGEYSAARELYGKSIQVSQQVGLPDAIVDKVRINMVMLLSKMGLFAEAEDYLGAITTSQNAMQRNICEAEINMLKGNYSRALQIYEQILSSDDDSKTFVARQNRGYLLSQSDNSDTLKLAHQDITKALEYMDSNTYSYYITLSNLALTEARLSDFDSAMRNILKSEVWFKNRYQPSSRYPDYIIILRKKAEILMLQHKWTEAQKAYETFFNKEKEYTVSNFSSMSEQNRLDFWKKEKPFLTEIFKLEDKCPDFLYDVALFRREVAMLGGGTTTKSDSLQLARQMQQRLRIVGNDVRRQLRMGELAIDFIRYIQSDGIQRYGAIVVPSLASGKPVHFVPLWTEDELNKFKVGDRSLLSAVCSPSKKSDKNMIYSSTALAEFIWRPLAPYIEKATDVYFAPDGLLHMLAIEYIAPHARLKSTIKLHRQTSTANLLYRTPTTSKNRKTLAVGGLDYDANTPGVSPSANHDAVEYLRQCLNGHSLYFKYLEGTKSEVIVIDSISANAYKTFDLTEEQFKHELQSRTYSSIHLATHGYALQVSTPSLPYTLRDSITEDKSLLASGVALSGANVAYTNSAQEDGILSARELCDMDLSNINLMVISACQSAQGTVSDEGPAGLVRGLKKAGVKSVIATLWEVDDAATNIFMKAFYESLSKSSDKHKALLAAQQTVREYTRVTPLRTTFDSARMKTVITPGKSEQIYTSPYFWAGFILIDE